MSQSTPPQPPQAPGAYPSAPGYPPYGYYPWFAPQPPQPPTPAERPARPDRARLANVVIAVAAAASTVVALALAAVAPAVAGQAPSPTSLGFHQAYDAQLTDDSASWDVSQGCAFEQGGLHATVNTDGTGTVCQFKPSASSDLTSQGFFLTAEARGAAAVNAQQQPCIAFEGQAATYELTFDQSGNGLLDLNPGHPCGDDLSTTPSGTQVWPPPVGAVPLGSLAWHADAFTHNRISVSYAATDQTMTVYINDQRLFQQNVTLSGQFTIDLGASGSGEAVFSRFTLYSGSAS